MTSWRIAHGAGRVERGADPTRFRAMAASSGHRVRSTRPTRAAAALLVLIGLVLIGQTLYIHAKALLAQVLLERAFAETIATGHTVKPWSWADTWPVARIAVPRLQKSAIALAGSSGQALAFGPGHVEGSAAAGEAGTAVYSAHRDTHFAFLGDIAIGDVIEVTRADGRPLAFRVTRTAVVAWDASGIDLAADGRRLILATCWPLEARVAGPLRYLVHAELEVPPVAPRRSALSAAAR